MLTELLSNARTNNTGLSIKNGESEMASNRTQWINRTAMTVAAAVAAVGATFVGTVDSAAATSDPVPGFIPDGVNFIPAAGFDWPAAQVVSYLNGGNFSPDGVSNIRNRTVASPVIAMFTSDGVNQVESVGSPAVARPQVLAYLNGGNFSPDGVSNLAYHYAEINDPSYVG